MKQPNGVHVARADGAPRQEIPAGTGTSMQVLVGAEQEGATFVMRRFRMERGGGIPLHTNEVEHEQYVLRGRARMRIGDTDYEVSADDTLFIPAGVPHAYEVLEGPFEFLCVVPKKADQLRILDEGC